MATTFLHQDRAKSADELVFDKPPDCVRCNEEMWLTSVAKSISNHGTDGVYTYECKTCGVREKVTCHAERADRLPVVPGMWR